MSRERPHSSIAGLRRFCETVEKCGKIKSPHVKPTGGPPGSSSLLASVPSAMGVELFGKGPGRSHRFKLCEVASPDYLDICILRFRVFSANMCGKFLIAPALVHLHHFRERVAHGWPRRTEHPCTFGAAAPLKARPFNPYHRTARGHYWMPLGV